MPACDVYGKKQLHGPSIYHMCNLEVKQKGSVFPLKFVWSGPQSTSEKIKQKWLFIIELQYVLVRLAALQKMLFIIINFLVLVHCLSKSCCLYALWRGISHLCLLGKWKRCIHQQWLFYDISLLFSAVEAFVWPTVTAACPQETRHIGQSLFLNCKIPCSYNENNQILWKT